MQIFCMEAFQGSDSITQNRGPDVVLDGTKGWTGGWGPGFMAWIGLLQVGNCSLARCLVRPRNGTTG